jgi:hypothetical protein
MQRQQMQMKMGVSLLWQLIQVASADPNLNFLVVNANDVSDLGRLPL